MQLILCFLMYVNYVEHLQLYRDARVDMCPNGQNVARLTVFRDVRVIRRTEEEHILFSKIPEGRQHAIKKVQAGAPTLPQNVDPHPVNHRVGSTLSRLGSHLLCPKEVSSSPQI